MANNSSSDQCVGIRPSQRLNSTRTRSLSCGHSSTGSNGRAKARCLTPRRNSGRVCRASPIRRGCGAGRAPSWCSKGCVKRGSSSLWTSELADAPSTGSRTRVESGSTSIGSTKSSANRLRARKCELASVKCESRSIQAQNPFPSTANEVRTIRTIEPIRNTPSPPPPSESNKWAPGVERVTED